ncbi:MAG: DNA primase, partial [Desulfobacterales bacterium]|nr:DNA primase [Desulfobacterales bacterium]
MYIPEDKIAEILNASDIVDIVSESVILKKSGRNFFGLCPFHAEKTPSFSVNPDKQIFHCFGCSTGGNALSFVMKYHGISFPEAVKMVARKYNIVIETQSVDPAKQREMKLKESLFRLNKRAMQYFQDNFKNDPAAQGARSYLAKRKISMETLETFGLGFSREGWDGMVGFLRREKVSQRAALNSGLILPRKQGNGFYDRFRNRLMFPIFDINMQVAGFGGRVMNDEHPKYMNSPETPVYNKSRILYGLHQSKQYCRREGVVYIVEGYFDFLSLYQNGVKNSVASLGTALTSEHVRILKGYAKTMTLVFDSDAAGINAAKRSIKIFMKEGVDTRILVLPKGHDPDSYVVEYGADAFVEMASNAQTVMQFLLKVAMESHGMSVEGRVRVLEDMKSHLAVIQDSALRSLYIKEIAEKLNIDEKAVLEKVRQQYHRDRTQAAGPLMAPQVEEEVNVPRDSDPRERQVLSIMLAYPDFIGKIMDSGAFDYFYSERYR